MTLQLFPGIYLRLRQALDITYDREDLDPNYDPKQPAPYKKLELDRDNPDDISIPLTTEPLPPEEPPPQQPEEQLPEFINGYLQAALWSSLDNQGNQLNHSFEISDFNDRSVNYQATECLMFLTTNQEALQQAFQDNASLQPADAGAAFWLARSNPGTQSFMSEWSTAEQLQDAAKQFPPTSISLSSGELVITSRRPPKRPK